MRMYTACLTLNCRATSQCISLLASVAGGLRNFQALHPVKREIDKARRCSAEARDTVRLVESFVIVFRSRVVRSPDRALGHGRQTWSFRVVDACVAYRDKLIGTPSDASVDMIIKWVLRRCDTMNQASTLKQSTRAPQSTQMKFTKEQIKEAYLRVERGLSNAAVDESSDDDEDSFDPRKLLGNETLQLGC
eukprot:6188446-Amphidinium_carterae.1